MIVDLATFARAVPGLDLKERSQREAAEDVLNAVTEEIAVYLRRPVLCEVTELRPTWIRRPEGRYHAPLAAWPVVCFLESGSDDPDGTSPDALTLSHPVPSAQHVECDFAPPRLLAVCGYRRADETLEMVQERCPEASVLPRLVPPLVAQVATTLAAIDLNARVAGEGLVSKEISVGTGTVTTTRVDLRYRNTVLYRLDTLRSLIS